MRQTGVLSNSYIVPLSSKVIANMLGRLEAGALYELAQLWTKWHVTYPHLTKELKQNRVTQQEFAKEVWSEIEIMKTKKYAKRKLIDRIIAEYWTKGLNALQLAQIEIQGIVDRPSGYSWVSSVAKVISDGRPATEDSDDFIFSLSSQEFLENLIKSLSSLFLTHIYVSRHPKYPLIMIRIQVFEFTHLSLRRGNGRGGRPEIYSRKPYFLAIPMSSPHVIHSEGDDLVSNIVIQAVEMTLSSTQRQIKLVKSAEPPVRSLDTMHIFKGVSRFSNSLGSWAPYADGTVDLSPLADPVNHLSLNPSRLASSEDKENDDAYRVRKETAAVRFRGTLGKFESERMYEHVTPIKRKPIVLEGEDEDMDEAGRKTEYSSIAPVQFAEFSVRKREGTEKSATFKMFLMGNDIFAGMHELAVQGVVDIDRIPGWLTGAEGNTPGVIEDGAFKKKKRV
ncbi:unnamed protein product [Kuraishia capsulata CBS 1993]|uniref:CHL4-domain-containing protein n=1 Tax=Kuraishia capsulata CBS 1993 TaxID=1382522 RepID=W6MNQ0_9ASCO|nr:uncharacterized protein KUCA_T00002661001 [Kuraishia capsulata CBS 1993]CDK26687.1 unnamed protein product [Kuraishia capsulata CBS 1993]